MEVQRLDNLSNNKKIVEFRKYYAQCQEIEKSFELQVSNDIITLNEVREKREKMTKSLEKLVLEIHTSNINQGKGKDTRWFTPITKGGKRVIIKKNTYEEIIDELIEFYGVGKEKVTLRSLYPQWLKNMQSQGASPSYLRRIDFDWRKYYQNDKIIDRELKSLSVNEIKSWLTTNLTKYELNSKKFYNMQTIFKQIIKYANEEELIEKNPFDKISFPKAKYFKGESNKQRQIEGLKKEVFNEDDIKKIKELALKDFRDNPSNSTSTASLGVLLLFNSGLRVGELVAIRERNIFDDYLWIEEEEQRDYIISIDEKTQKVVCTYNGTKVGKAKTNASFRKVPLTKEAKEIIKLVLETNKANGFKDEDFLFVNATQRMQENTILKRIYKLCDEAFIDKRSPHKIRKTFASMLVNKGIMDISEVSSILGHVGEQTLINHYLYSTKSANTRLDRLEQSLAI